MAFLLRYSAALLVFCIFQSANSTDYCDRSLCKTGQHHIGCNNDGQFGKACSPDAKIIEMTEHLRKHIVEKHNLLRQQDAYDKKAGRMAMMAWDDELAKLAELKVRQCEAKRDECHNTKTYPNSGQNVGLRTDATAMTLDQDILAGFIQKWYNEYEYATPSDIQNYDSSKWTNGKTIEHFGLVMNEAATRVGCALVEQTIDGVIHYIMACNYASNLVDGKPIYLVTVRAGNKCLNGRDEEFFYMCTPNEVYKN